MVERTGIVVVESGSSTTCIILTSPLSSLTHDVSVIVEIVVGTLKSGRKDLVDIRYSVVKTVVNLWSMVTVEQKEDGASGNEYKFLPT